MSVPIGAPYHLKQTHPLHSPPGGCKISRGMVVPTPNANGSFALRCSNLRLVIISGH